jgi:rhodanese-related sulfurtransferase
VREGATATLVFGRASGLVRPGEVIEVPGAGAVTEVDGPQALRVQLNARFGLGLITASAWRGVAPGERRLLVHNLVAHLVPGARVWIDVGQRRRDEACRHALACGLQPLAGTVDPMFRRTSRTTVHDLLAEARAQLVRLTPQALAARLDADPDCLVLDTRTPTDRARFGAVVGSIHLPRTTLEWRVDLSSGYSHPRIRSLEQPLVVVCNEGYSSSLAAASLQQLGFAGATDLIGGFAAWREAGLPVEPVAQ